MPEPILAWWARRQLSRRSAVPYAVGTYREAWAPYPVLVRQYHPEYNGGIVLTPGAARGRRVPLLAVRDRARLRRDAGGAAGAAGARAAPIVVVPGVPRNGGTPPNVGDSGVGGGACAGSFRFRARRRPLDDPPVRVVLLPSRRSVPRRRPLPPASPSRASARPRPPRPSRRSCGPISRHGSNSRPGVNAVRLAQPFFDHLEAWPDILLPELRVAIEYDSTGRHGLEHVGKREVADRRKDRLLRAAGWEVSGCAPASCSRSAPTISSRRA